MSKPTDPAIPPARPLHHLTHTHAVPGKLKVTELFFEVPLDYSDPGGKRIRIFCRTAEKLETPIVPKKVSSHDYEDGEDEKLPIMVFVTGGPGFGSPMPQDCGWTGGLLKRGYRVLYFDHRGMGLSTPVTAATVRQYSTEPEKQADYLGHFRADNAVRDLEAIRQTLTSTYPAERKKWSVMGQSYGGFVVLNYLSFHPQGLREVFVFGGLAPVTQRVPDDVIRRLFRRVEMRNRKYYDKYPEDRERVRRVVKFLEEKTGLPLPDGGKMTARRFLSMGFNFGFHGGLDRVHDVVLRGANDLDTFGYLTRPTLGRIMGQGMQLEDHPIYALLHEAAYCQGRASRWAFSRILDENPKFSLNSQSDEIFFTGEMVFREAFEDVSELKVLAPAAAELANVDDWPDLYDLDQLRRNEVPVYAATYMDDLYVDFDLAQETAGLIKGCKTFITNALYHDAIRSKVDEVFKYVFALRDDSID